MKCLPPFGYYGGKSKWIEFIHEHLPPAHNFLDLFGGSGAVSLSVVDRYTQVVYNDINGRLVGFFRTLRDHPREVERIIGLTPSSRAEFDACFEVSPDPIEDTRRVFTLINQSFMKKGLWSAGGWQFHGLQKNRSSAAFFEARKERLPQIAQVLRKVDIECRDWRSLLPHAKAHTLIFADPPYDLDARSGGQGYHDEFTEADHIELANALEASPAKAVICGYRSPLYDRLYARWVRHSKVVSCNFANIAGAKGSERQECIWAKPSQGAATLFTDE